MPLDNISDQILNRPNTLNEWVDDFEKIGIPSNLLKTAFSDCAELPSFESLFHNCQRRLRQKNSNKVNLTFSRIDSIWQLLALTGESRFIEKLINPSLCDKKDNMGALLIHLLFFSSKTNLIERLIKVYPDLKDSKDNSRLNLLHYAGLSGNPEVIAWVLREHADLKYTKTNDGLNLLHCASLSGNPEAIAWVLKEYPDLKDSKTIYGQNLLHYAGLSGKPEAIAWVLKEYPDLKDSEDNYGRNLLHYASLSGKPKVIAWLLKEYPDLNDSKNNYGRNLLHYASWSGKPEAIAWVLKEYPDLKDSNTNDGRNLLHYASWSGKPEAIAWVLRKYPELKDSKANNGQNLLHYAGLSGNPEAIAWVLNKYPELKDSKTNDGQNLLHFACWSGNPESIAWVLNKYPELKDSKTNDGQNHLHYTCWSGKPEAIAWVLREYPDLKDSKANNGQNLLHVAGWSGHPETIAWVLKEYPDLKESKDNNGLNLLHYASWSGHPEAIAWVLDHDPILAFLLWTKDLNGDTPNSYAIKSKMNPSPTKILHNKLLASTYALMNNTSSENQILLLDRFSAIWKEMLIQDEQIPLLKTPKWKELALNPRLPASCKTILSNLTPLLALKKENTENIPLTLNVLLECINLAIDWIKQRIVGLFFKSNKRSLLLDELIAFAYCARQKEQPNEILSSDGIVVLNLLLNDGERHLRNPDTADIDNLLTYKLRTTSTLSALRPKPNASQGLDITPSTYMNHFQKMNTVFSSLSVSSDVKNTVNKTILPGIKHLIERMPDIITHIKANFGVLYYLDDEEKLPLHTDHVESQNTTDIEKMLHRILENLFGAFYTCQEAGKSEVFFTKLTQGYCFEGRTRDLFSWAAAFSEIKTFDAFMEEQFRDYSAYSRYVHGQSNKQFEYTKPVADFILRRFDKFPCRPNEKYAPDGEITRKGVEDYLSDVLCFESIPPSGGCLIC